MSKPKSSKKAAKAGKTSKSPKPLPKLVADEKGHATVQDESPATTAAPKPVKEKAARVAKEKAPKEDLVVFAFRLTPAERDAIHAAAGPAKASKFVRLLAVAAANGDETGIRDLLKVVGAAK